MQELKSVIEIVNNANNIQLSEEKTRWIYEQMSCYKAEKNQIISQIGSVDNNLSVLLSGIMRLYYIDSDGNDITRYFGTKGCISVGTDERLPYVVETLQTCEFLTIEWAKVRELIEDDIYWLKIWNKLLQNSIQYKIYRESCFLTESATERYIDFKRMYPGLEKQVHQSYIASYLGITPVSLSRIRRTIREEQ